MTADRQFSVSAGNVLVGMVHVQPLPGSPAWAGSMTEVVERALRDADALTRAGFDALLIENFGDAPFFPEHVPPETIAGLTAVAQRVASASGLPIGINVLRNDARAALGIAAAVEAAFIRVNVHTGAMLTDQGWINGRAHDTLRQRRQLGTQIAICADVLVKHALPAPGTDLAASARDTWQRGHADVLIVSGAATGSPTDPDRVLTVKHAVPTAPVWVGSGVNAENLPTLLRLADGAIVGSAIKEDGQASGAVDARRASRLVALARAG